MHLLIFICAERTSKEEVSIRFSDDLARTNAEDTGSKKKCQTVNQVSITSEASLALYQVLALREINFPSYMSDGFIGPYLGRIRAATNDIQCTHLSSS